MELLKPHLLGRERAKGVAARDNRLFINAFFGILRTGSSWRNLPSDYGDWKNTHRRFCRWRDNGGGNQDMGRKRGVQLKDTSDREFAWYVGQNGHHVRCRCGLYAGLQTHEGFDAGYILADRGYDSNNFIKYIAEYGMEAVIPLRKNRKIQREYDHCLYHCRHQFENALAELNKYRVIAIKYTQYTASFGVVVHIRHIAIWTKNLLTT